MSPTRLKDMRWDLPGYNGSDGLSLESPRISISKVSYNVNEMTADIEVRFRELKGEARYEHSRVFVYALSEDSQESISAENVQNFIAQVFPDAVLVVK